MKTPATINIDHVVLNIKGISLKLTVAELRKLRDEIDAVVGRVPASPVYLPPPMYPWNWPNYSTGGASVVEPISLNPNSEEWPNNWGVSYGDTSNTLIIEHA